MTEARILSEILAAIGARPGLRVWRNNSGALTDIRGRLVRYGLVGSADILGIMAPAGRLVAIEVKAPTGRPTEQQQAFANMVRLHGGLYVLARSVDDVMVAIDAAGGD